MRTNVRRLLRGARWVVATATMGAASATLGCHANSTHAGWAGTIDTTASGTIVVHNPKTGLWDSSTAWRVVEERRIGRVEGAGPDLFGHILELAVDGAGRVYAFDMQAQQLQVFDSTGRYVRTIGRRGHGPGEFENVAGMTWDPQGRLWIVDEQSDRVTIVDTSGQVLGDRPLHFHGAYWYPWPGTIDSAGDVYSYLADPRNLRPTELTRYDSALTPLDTVPLPRSSYPPAEFTGHTQISSSQISSVTVPVPFAPALAWYLTKSATLWSSELRPYQLVHTTWGGDTLLVVDRALDPIPVTSEDMDSAIAHLKWFIQQGGKIDRSKIPDVKPAIVRFYVDEADNLWVEPTARDTADRGRDLDVFDQGGRYLGDVHLPFRQTRFSRPLITRDHFYGVTRNADGVEFVVIARIERP